MNVVIFILLAIGVLLCLLIGGLYLFMQHKYTYWKRKGVPYTKPRFPMGNLNEVAFSKNAVTVFKELYDLGAGERFFGLFVLHRPILLIREPELIKSVLVRDFMHFHDHDFYYNEKKDPLSANLFSLEGTQWRNIRAKVTPTFTTGKNKMMLPMVVECAQNLCHVFGDVADGGGVCEVKDILGRFTTDVISTCAFGIQTNSLKQPDSMFRKMGNKIFEPTWTVILSNMINFMTPDLAAILQMNVTPKDVAKFFLGVFKETMDYREENNVRRNDFMQLMIQLKTQGFVDDVDSDNIVSDKDKFTFEQAAAQAYIFFLGGFETSSSVMTFMLYELALNPEIQKSVREEVLLMLSEHGGQVDYEALHSMTYMAMVIDETLRKYPPATIISRVCTKDYLIPGTDITINKGTGILAPNYGLHMDPQYFPDPERFDPERFTEDEKARRHPFTYLPFGGGPHHCIGQRFAHMELRVGISAILSKFAVEVCEQTPIPLEWDKKAYVIMSRTGVHLKITHLNQ